jgi:type 1 glutamine amidotransferase
MLRRSLGALIATVIVCLPLTLLAKEPKPLRALLIAGGCCHDYKGQNQVLTKGISERIRIEWTVVLHGKNRAAKVPNYEKKDWAKGFDVVVHNECYGGVTDVKFVENITKAHLAGTPAVTIHCSTHSYRNAKTDEWRKLLGVTSRSHEKHRPFTVKTLDKKHPIMTGFHDGWIPPNGELYKIEKLWPNCKPLAKAYGKDTKKDHVVIWTNTYGKGRVFGTTIGHHTETQKEKMFLDLVTRGLLWSCGKLEKDGRPADGYEKEPSAEPTKKSKEKKPQKKSKEKKPQKK